MGAVARLDMVAIEKWIATDSAVWTQLMAAGEEAVKYWQSESPTGEVTHTFKGRTVRPGDYKASIRATMLHTKDGRRFVRVRPYIFTAGFVEYNTRGKFGNGSAPCAKTRAYMLGKAGYSSASKPVRSDGSE